MNLTMNTFTYRSFIYKPLKQFSSRLTGKNISRELGSIRENTSHPTCQKENHSET